MSLLGWSQCLAEKHWAEQERKHMVAKLSTGCWIKSTGCWVTDMDSSTGC